MHDSNLYHILSVGYGQATIRINIHRTFCRSSQLNSSVNFILALAKNLKMFRFHRKKGKSRGTETPKKKNNFTFGGEPTTVSQNAGRTHKSVGNGPFEDPPTEMRNLDGFLDHMSIDTSLYTTPSKPTIQYHSRHTPIVYNIDWESSEGSDDQGVGTTFTAELALDQFKLGGWQSPPAIEPTLTPSTAEPSDSSASSSSRSPSPSPQPSPQPSPSITYREEKQEKVGTRERADSYNKVFRSGWVKHPEIPTCLHTSTDYDSLVFEHVKDSYLDAFERVRDSHLEAQSAASTEISWHFDSRAYHEKLSSEAVTPSVEPKTPTVPQNVGADVRRTPRGEEESMCSSVSSIYTNGYCHDTPQSNISTWSATASPVDHVVLKEDAESSCRDLCDGGASQGQEEPSNFDDENEVSFSELISRCEEESLVERLAPHCRLPPKRLFGRIIDTNSLDSFQGSFSSNLSRTQDQDEDSPYEANLSTPKENQPHDSAPDDDRKLEAPIVEVKSNQKASPTMKSTIKTQNLNLKMQLPASRTLPRQQSDTIINVSGQSDSDDESHKSDESDDDLKQNNSVVSERTFHFDTSHDTGVSGRDKTRYTGPVDLDESISSWEENGEDDARERRSDRGQEDRKTPPAIVSKRATPGISPSQGSIRREESKVHNREERWRQPSNGYWGGEKSVRNSPALKNMREGSQIVSVEPYQHSREKVPTPTALRNSRPTTIDQKNSTLTRKKTKWKPFTRFKNKKEKEDERITKASFASPETTLSLNRSPKTVTTLPPCTVCKTAERTHISLPCMHYSFCSICAETLNELVVPTCPICQTQEITLSRVYL